MHARYVCDMSSVQVWFRIGAVIFAHVCVCVWVRVCVRKKHMRAGECDISTIPHVYVSHIFFCFGFFLVAPAARLPFFYFKC